MTQQDISHLLREAALLGMNVLIKDGVITLVPPTKKASPKPNDLFGVQSWNPSPQMLEVASWFGRRPTTVWSPKEQKAWKEITRWFKFEGDDWDALKWFYTQSGCKFVRKNLETLLNNWQGEIDRAKNYDPNEK